MLKAGPRATARSKPVVAHRLPSDPEVRRSPLPNRWYARLEVIVGIGFLLRLCTILVKHTYRMSPVDPMNTIENFKFSFESGMVAGSLASGLGFASPFGGNTGPTAWLAPVYPYLTAGVFKIFGIYTESSALVLLVLNALFSALTCVPVYFIARRFSDARIARWTAWMWALLPAAMYWSIKLVWETSLSAFLLTTLIWLTLELEKRDSVGLWLSWGALWAILALTNPACCLILPFAGIWLCWRRQQLGRKWFALSALGGIVFLLVITPWEMRNLQIFHRVLPIRDNAAAELRMGNSPGSDGLWMSWAHPSQSTLELARFRELGEPRYIALKGAEAKQFIREDPVRFLKLCLNRMVYFWAGVPKPGKSALSSASKNLFFMLISVMSLGGLFYLLRQRTPGTFVLLVATAIYPITYYVTFVDARYRHPIEPVLVFLGTYLVFQARELRTEPERLPMEDTQATVGSVAA